MTEPKIDHTVEYWETLDAVPLPPGWVNVFDGDDGRSWSLCPALLKQELRETARCYSDGTVRTHRHEPPLEIRIVPGDVADGRLEDATEAANYVATVHESEVDRLP